MAKALLYIVGTSDVCVNEITRPPNFCFITQRVWGIIEKNKKIKGIEDGWEIKDSIDTVEVEKSGEQTTEKILLRKITFPVLVHVIKELKDKKLTKVYFFATSQKPPHPKDTIYAAMLMEQFIKKRLKKIQINIEKIEENPSDYDKMSIFFRKFFAIHQKELETNAENYVSITTGTPAQVSSLALNIMDFPVRYIYVYERGVLTYCDSFNKLNKKIYARIIQELIRDFRYSSALEVAQNSPFRRNPDLLILLERKKKRAFFDFEGALTTVRALGDEEFSFLIEKLSNLARRDNETLCLELFYHFENAIHTKKFLEAVALLFSLLDYVLQYLFTQLTGVRIKKHNGHFVEFNEYIEKNKELKDFLEKERIKYENNPSQPVLVKILNFVKRKGMNTEELALFLELVKELDKEKETTYGKLSLRELRNSGPYAHGIRGINEEILNQLLYPLSIGGFLKKVKECIKDICKKEPQNSFEIINKKLIEMLEKEII